MTKRTSLMLIAPALAGLLFLGACAPADRAARNGAERTPEQQAQRAEEMAREAEQQAQEAQRTAQEALQMAQQALHAQRQQPPANGVHVDPQTNGAPLPAQPGQPPARQDPATNGIAAGELPAGTALKVRLGRALDSSRDSSGDTFTATLAEPAMVQGRALLPQGTQFNGRVVTAQPGILTVQLESVVLNGRTHRIETTTVSRVATADQRYDIGILDGAAAPGAPAGAPGEQHVQLPANTQMILALQQPANLGQAR